MQFGFVKRQLVLRQSRRSQKLPYGSSFVRSGEMDDLVELHAAEQLVKRRPIRQVAMHEFKRTRQRLNLAEVSPLQPRIVEVVEVVKSPDCMAETQQTLANMRTDKTSAAGNQKVHIATLPDQPGGCRGPPLCPERRL